MTQKQNNPAPAPTPVIPAQAGIHTDPQTAQDFGVKAAPVDTMDSRLRGNDGLREASQDRFTLGAQPAMQSRRDSWREAWQNTALAFCLSILAHRYVVMPTLDIWAEAGNDRADWSAAICVTLFYTALSLGRNYAIRRWHARQDHARQMQN